MSSFKNRDHASHSHRKRSPNVCSFRNGANPLVQTAIRVSRGERLVPAKALFHGFLDRHNIVYDQGVLAQRRPRNARDGSGRGIVRKNSRSPPLRICRSRLASKNGRVPIFLRNLHRRRDFSPCVPCRRLGWFSSGACGRASHSRGRHVPRLLPSRSELVSDLEAQSPRLKSRHAKTVSHDDAACARGRLLVRVASGRCSAACADASHGGAASDAQVHEP